MLRQAVHCKPEQKILELKWDRAMRSHLLIIQNIQLMIERSLSVRNKKSFGTEEERLIKEIETIISLCDDDAKQSVFENIFIAENYQKLLSKKEDIRRRILGDE